MKSNTTLLAECFAALPPRQLRSLAWHASAATPIVCSKVRYIDGEGGG